MAEWTRREVDDALGAQGASMNDLRAELTRRGRDFDALTPLLDHVAQAAGRGQESATDLLLWTVDSLGLAQPTIRRLVLDEAGVDDVHQNVLIAVAESVSSFRGDSRFSTWLVQIARFKSLDHLRRQRNVPDGRVLRDSDVARISSIIATRVAIADILAQLPDQYREPVMLRDIDQLDYDEISSRLGLNPATVRSRVARGRALVAGRLKKRF